MRGDEETTMKYIMLVYQGAALDSQAELSEQEQKQVYADYQGISQTPGVTTGPPMGHPQNATTVRVEGGRTITTDGPFVGMKEAVGSYFVLEADDLDAAIELAARVPAARHGGAVEIRPSEVYW
ncbi:YciI family protein [Flindersiella endophytica]